MEFLSDHERSELAHLKDTRQEFDCYPPSMQIVWFAQFLTSKGLLQFTPEHIKQLFRAADMTSPRTGKRIDPRPSVVIRHVNAAVEKGKLPVEWDEEGGCWSICSSPMSFIFTANVTKANDHVHAKDIVKWLPGIYDRRLVAEHVDGRGPWCVTVEVLPRLNSPACVRNEILAILSEIATRWEITLGEDGTIKGESQSPKKGKIASCSFRLKVRDGCSQTA